MVTSTDRTARSLIQDAANAASEVADLRQRAARIDPYTPLAVWGPPLRKLDHVLGTAADGLHRAAQLARDIGETPALPGAAPAAVALSVASTRTNHAADLTRGTIVAIRRELRGADVERDTSSHPLSRHAAYAEEYLRRLNDALSRAGRVPDPDLAELAAALAVVARQQSQILADLSHVCDRYHYGVSEACERIPKTTSAKVTRISGQLRRASATLRKAGRGAAVGANDIDNELARARRRARA